MSGGVPVQGRGGTGKESAPPAYHGVLVEARSRVSLPHCDRLKQQTLQSARAASLFPSLWLGEEIPPSSHLRRGVRAETVIFAEIVGARASRLHHAEEADWFRSLLARGCGCCTMIEVVLNDRLGKKIRVKCK